MTNLPTPRVLPGPPWWRGEPMKVTIKEAQDAKAKLEAEISRALTDFSNEIGLDIQSIDIYRPGQISANRWVGVSIDVRL